MVSVRNTPALLKQIHYGEGLTGTRTTAVPFKTPEQELAFSFQLRAKQFHQNSLTQSGNDPSLLRNEKNDNRGINLGTTLQLDYAHPFSKKVNWKRDKRRYCATLTAIFLTAN